MHWFIHHLHSSEEPSCQCLHCIWLYQGNAQRAGEGAWAVPVLRSTSDESSPICMCTWGQSSRGPSETSHEHHQHENSAVRDAPSQSSASLCSHVRPRQILNQGTFTFSQSQLHDRLCNTLGKYWLGSNRLKIFGLHQMWCVCIFETLAKGVIWENKNCRWMCLLCKVVHIVPRCQKCAWRFHPQEESQLWVPRCTVNLCVHVHSCACSSPHDRKGWGALVRR